MQLFFVKELSVFIGHVFLHFMAAYSKFDAFPMVVTMVCTVVLPIMQIIIYGPTRVIVVVLSVFFRPFALTLLKRPFDLDHVFPVRSYCS